MSDRTRVKTTGRPRARARGHDSEMVSPRPSPSHAHASEGAWRALQRSLGNRGAGRLLALGRSRRELPPRLQRVVQRALSAEQKAENLKAARFAADPQLEAAFDNSPPLRWGARGDGVAKVQQALIDSGFQMPVSTRKTGSPDGIYGKETWSTVKEFQQAHKLEIDGKVGRETLGRLDAMYAGPAPPKTTPKDQPEIGATESEIGKHVVDDMDKANDFRRNSPSSGIWYPHQYEAMHKRDPAHFPWSPDLRLGYANPAYWVRVASFHWLLKPGVSASSALKDWLHGLTIAECNSTLVAIQINALRAAVGDSKFDEAFGSADKPIPLQQRLRVKSGTKGTPLETYMKQTEAASKGEKGTPNNRPAKVGGWHYFYNHPKYLLKHPNGAFQGENAIYVGRNKAGDQVWSGFGVSNVTEAGMLTEMKEAHNQERSQGDYRVLVEWYAPHAPELRQPTPNYPALYIKYIDRIPDEHRHDKGVYPDKIDEKAILSAPEYELWGTKRKGGYVGESGLVFDVEKVKALRNG
ncbi:MAG: peptidoglycan-binding protein [Anaerolineae bacterium]|nr:peptidoglycan-binding protein [Anaerolineae bacterium]